MDELDPRFAERLRELREMIDTIPALAWCAHRDGSAEFLNRRWLDYTGLSAEQALGWGWQAAIRPDDLDGLVEKWRSSLASGTPVEAEARMRRFDGQDRWFLFRAEPLRNESGEIVKWYGTNTDIEEKKRVEEALLASERNARHIVDSIPGQVVRLSAHGEVEAANPQVLSYFGTSLEGIKNWPTHGLVHPEDLPRAMEIARHSFETGEPYEMVIRVRRFDGEYRWFQTRGLPVRNPEGQIIQWYALHTDIDDHKQSEEIARQSQLTIRSIIDSIPGYVHTMRADGSVEFVNQRILDFFQKTAEELSDWAPLVHPQDRESVLSQWGEALATGEPYDQIHRVRRADGEWRWFHSRGLPLRDPSGQIVRWCNLLVDIDERKKGEEALRASERNLSLIVDSIPGLVARMSAAGEIELANRQLLAYFGKELEDIKNWTTSGIVHPDDLSRAIEIAGKSFAKSDPYEVEIRIRRFDGVYRWFQARAIPLCDAEGRILNWYSLHTDIEDRKKAEEALRSRQRELSVIIETMPGLVWCAFPDGELSYVNRRILDYFGVERNNVLSGGWAHFLHPDDVAPVVASWSHSVASGEAFEVQARLRGVDGTYRWFHSLSQLGRDTEGNPAQWYGVMIDVDDSKRAEEKVEQAYLRLAEAQRVSKTGSFITDLVADDHNWSEETFRIFEFDPKAKVTVQMIRDMVHPDDLLSFDTVIAQGMKGNDVDFVFRIVTPRGAVKHIRGMAHVLSQTEGHPLFIGALQDVTDSKVVEDTLNKARSELAHITRVTSLGVLTASIAHEINQPLAGIVTNANTCLRMLAADSPNFEGARETAKRIIRDVNRASELIARLRALFSRKSVTTEPVDLTEATREVLALLLNELQRNRVVVRADFADDPPLVSGDRIQLQQVIANLLRNASEAMNTVDDRPRLLCIAIRPHPGDQVCLSVADAGVGLDSEGMDRLFQPFYTTKTEGMGIGLSVSRSIIESHQGRLWATPNEGPGATFSFSIPAIPRGVRE